MKKEALKLHIQKMYKHLFWLEDEAVRLDGIDNFPNDGYSEKVIGKERQIRWSQYQKQKEMINDLLDCIL